MNAQNKNRVILVVDDEQYIREYLGEVFSDKGYTIMTAPNATAAFDMFLNDFVDVIITDICMPHGTGKELLEKLNEMPAYDRPLTYVISAYEALSTEELERYQVARFIKKPFDPVVVAGEIEEDLQKKVAASANASC